MRRGLLTAILAAGCVVAIGPHAVAQFNIPVPGGLGSGGSAQSTTVKSSKSNTSDRMGGGGGKGSTAKTTTVKSSKSNTSDRMGGGGGKGSAAKATTVKSSKSNTSD
jgi:uncharacterized protein YdeI (BOF family)